MVWRKKGAEVEKGIRRRRRKRGAVERGIFIIINNKGREEGGKVMCSFGLLGWGKNHDCKNRGRERRWVG